MERRLLHPAAAATTAAKPATATTAAATPAAATTKATAATAGAEDNPEVLIICGEHLHARSGQLFRSEERGGAPAHLALLRKDLLHVAARTCTTRTQGVE